MKLTDEEIQEVKDSLAKTNARKVYVVLFIDTSYDVVYRIEGIHKTNKSALDEIKKLSRVYGIKEKYYRIEEHTFT